MLNNDTSIITLRCSSSFSFYREENKGGAPYLFIFREQDGDIPISLQEVEELSIFSLRSMTNDRDDSKFDNSRWFEFNYYYLPMSFFTSYYTKVEC